MKIYDSIIIGKGPAGIQAALYIKRANFNVLVIGKDGGSLEKADKIENLYGQETVLSGKDLINKGISQMEQIGVSVLTDEVVGIEFGDSLDYFKVKSLKNEYYSKTVLIATGINKNRPRIKGIEDFEGRGVSYCAICDGFFYKDKEVVVIGNSDYAVSEVENLLSVTNKITILTNGKDEVLVRDKDVNCNTKKIEAIVGENKVQKVVFEDQTTMDVSGVFVAEGSAASTDFARKLGAEIEENKIVVNNENMQTSVVGIYAAGDCTGGEYQISKAMYEGMKAGLSIVKFLRKGG